MASSVLLLLGLVALSAEKPLQAPRHGREQGPWQGNSSRATGPLVFDSDGTFQLSIFEDLHFGENAWDTWGPQHDVYSVTVMNKVLDRESPGLVVLNGDLITGENTFKENSSVYVDQIVGPLVQRGLPWASTYGNHDHDFNLSAAAMLARERRWPNARTRSMVAGGPDVGVSNYWLPVYEEGGCCTDGCAPALLLWFFDSRGGFYYRERQADGGRRALPGWVDARVVAWFEATAAQQRARWGRTIPSLAFVHIPTNASRALQPSVDAHRQPGINDDDPLAAQGQGWCADGRNAAECDYGGQDVPFMRALAATPGLVAVFSGHDHGATWCHRWVVPGAGPAVGPVVGPRPAAGRGLDLCFGQHSGYGGYGRWIRGARQVRVDARRPGEAETWIRLESGAVVGGVTLNATYGRDWYPATPNDMTECPGCNTTAGKG